MMTLARSPPPADLANGPRIVWCSDTHLGHGQPTRRTVRPNDRGPDFFANFARVIEHARESRAAALVHTGDFFFRSRVHPAIVDRAYGMLLDAADHFPVVIVPGNHERSAMPPSVFLHHRNLHVIASPRTVVLSLDGMRIGFSGFPFVREVGRHFAAKLAATDHAGISADAKYLLLHQSVEGATVGPAEYSFHAVDPEVIPQSVIPAGFAGILCGHIHRHQCLNAASPVLFSGSTERTSFAEAAETKGFCELWPESGAARFVPLPTRPMCTYAADLGSYSAWVGRQDHRAILRVRAEDVDYETMRRAVLPTQVLTPIFPRESRAPRLNSPVRSDLA